MDINANNLNELLESVSQAIRCKVAGCVEAYSALIFALALNDFDESKTIPPRMTNTRSTNT